MSSMRFFVYILTNRSYTVLYSGMTDQLYDCVVRHRSGRGGPFTRKYRVGVLVYAAEFDNREEAARHLKKIKGGSRYKKVCLISAGNPYWNDLAGQYRNC